MYLWGYSDTGEGLQIIKEIIFSTFVPCDLNPGSLYRHPRKNPTLDSSPDDFPPSTGTTSRPDRTGTDERNT